MNKKTFTLALVFFCATVVWLGVNIYWLVARPACVCLLDLLIAFLFVLAGAGMTWNEYISVPPAGVSPVREIRDLCVVRALPGAGAGPDVT